MYTYNIKIEVIIIKRFYIILISLFLLAGCKISSKKSEDNYNIDANYNLNAAEINGNNVSEEDSGIYVAAKAMQATVEITCAINYSYTINTIFGTQTKTNTQASAGTGFFINEDGYLMTNAHVVETGYESYDNYKIISSTIFVNYALNEQNIDIEIIAKNTELDLAILKLKNNINNLKYLTFYKITENDCLYYGETVFAVGNAYGYGISITKGICSAPIRRFSDPEKKEVEAIQTDAAINSGNSGGPLLNKYSCVIGINSFKLASTGVEGLGFAIPSNVVIEYIKSVDSNINYYYTNNRSFTPNITKAF